MLCFHCCGLVAKSCPTVYWLHGLQPTGLLCSWDYPGKNTSASCRFFLPVVFLTQELNMCLLHIFLSLILYQCCYGQRMHWAYFNPFKYTESYFRLQHMVYFGHCFKCTGRNVNFVATGCSSTNSKASSSSSPLAGICHWPPTPKAKLLFAQYCLLILVNYDMTSTLYPMSSSPWVWCAKWRQILGS